MIWENLKEFLTNENAQALIVFVSAVFVAWARTKMNSASKDMKASVFNWKSTDINAKRSLELIERVSVLVRENKSLEEKIEAQTICLEKKIDFLSEMLKEIVVGSSIKDVNKLNFAKHYDNFRKAFTTNKPPLEQKETIVDEIVTSEEKEKEEKIKKVDSYIENAKRLAGKGDEDGKQKV